MGFSDLELIETPSGIDQNPTPRSNTPIRAASFIGGGSQQLDCDLRDWYDILLTCAETRLAAELAVHHELSGVMGEGDEWTFFLAR